MKSLQSNRLAEPWGCLIERTQERRFFFEGKEYVGYAGDTLSSALAANNQWVLSRSFKYHRIRGSMTFAGLDANSYVTIGDQPNVSADLRKIEPDLRVKAQNVLGSLKTDWAAVSGLLSRFLPVGFYYRAFYRPRGIWPIWEKFFRRAAGLGKINPQGLRTQYFDKQYAQADVVVIGAGPAGLTAAIAAAEETASVVLIEESTILGGSLNYARNGRKADDVADLRKALVEQVSQHERIVVHKNATCSGWFADNWLSVDQSNRLLKLRAKQVVLCTGSVEQPVVFRNNDLPGVMLASAVQRLLRMYAVRPGSRAIIIAGNAEATDIYQDLLSAGVFVAAVIELPESTIPFDETVATADCEILRGFVPVEARRSIRKQSVCGLTVANSQSPNEQFTLRCDLIVSSVGYAPLAQLGCHSGGHMQYDSSIHAFRLIRNTGSGSAAGSVNQVFEIDRVLQDGARAGRIAACRALGKLAPASSPVTDNSAQLINHPYPIYPHPRGKEFVDMDEDQTIADLEKAVADGFDHPELAKRYSTAAMGPSQGRLSATNALRIVDRANPTTANDLYATTQRPPFRPISFGVLAGRSLQPERRTPMHEWHRRHGAIFMPAGLWQRPAYYSDGSARETNIRQEVAAVRRCAGLIDVSTLGGIDIRGPDSAEFLNRIYTFAYQKLAVGRTRYALMTDYAGAIVDDGVACRLAEDHFYVTTTTTGSDAVFQSMSRHRIEWDLNVDLVNVTSGYAAMNLAGPESRRIIESLDGDIDFSQEAFPYLGVRQGMLCNVPVRAIRVGFVGELGYELHIPSCYALPIWEHIVNLGVRPVGVEAQRVLRLEKGHLIVGQDTDGLTNPIEANLSWAIGKNKPNYVGLAAVNHFREGDLQRQLVGFEILDAGSQTPEECNLVVRNNQITGRVTSISFSEQLGKTIGLAYVATDQSAEKTDIAIKLSNGQYTNAIVTTLPFYDPSNTRQQT